MFDVILGCSAFGVALFFTGQLRNFALRKKLLDVPNFRSSHTIPTPRGGGLAIVFAFLLTVCFYFFTDKLSVPEFFAFAVSGLLVAGIGMADDISNVSAGLRFLVHCLAAILGIFWLGGVPALEVPIFSFHLEIITNILAVLFLVWLLNLFNFMDGIDGLAAMEASSAALGAALILFFMTAASRELWLLIFFAVSCLGFLCWNWPPARIFLGDAGSGFIGYTLGILMFITIQLKILNYQTWIILFGTFLVDATVTLIARIIKGERWYAAHCSHAYQCAARRYKSHKKVTLAFLCINVFWLLPLAWLATVQPNTGWLLAFIALTPLVLLVVQQRRSPKMPGPPFPSNS